MIATLGSGTVKLEYKGCEYIYRCISKNLNIMKKLFFFVTFKKVFFILMIRAYSSGKSKIQYLKILEYFPRSIKKKKKGFAKQKSSSSLKYVNFCTQYLVGAPLAQFQHQWGVAWKRSACGTAETLLSLQLICIVGSTVSHLSLENIP